MVTGQTHTHTHPPEEVPSLRLKPDRCCFCHRALLVLTAGWVLFGSVTVRQRQAPQLKGSAVSSGASFSP